jgi:hypothetical protein
MVMRLASPFFIWLLPIGVFFYFIFAFLFITGDTGAIIFLLNVIVKLLDFAFGLFAFV